MKNWLLNKIGETDNTKQKQKVKKMTTKMNLNALSNYSEEYIKKTTDFKNLQKVEEILAELTQQQENVDDDIKRKLQKFIDLYRTQQKALQKEAAIKASGVGGKIASSRVDLELLNKYSEDYMIETTEFNSIEEVECKLVELMEQYEKAEGDTKRNIQDLIDTYQLQQKQLVLREATEKKAREIENKRNSQNKEKDDNNTMFSDNSEVESGKKADVVMKTVENPYGKKTPKSPKRKYNNGEEGEHSKKKVVWNLNEAAETNNKESTGTVNKLFPNENGENGNNYSDKKDNKKHYIRIRFQFKANTMKKNGQKTHNECIRELLYDMMSCAKHIDNNASLKPWDINSKQKTLNGNEIKIFGRDEIQEYIDIPDLGENLIHGKIYYRCGMCIQTEMEVYEFTERWCNNKYSKDPNNPFCNWRPIRPAEMQKSHVAYPIGYFVGTTERGDYTTIQETISSVTGTETEVSYQFVNQDGVSQRVWKYAREQAELYYPDPVSKEHKRIKFSYAPSALVVYVAKKEAIKMARRTLVKKYGKLVENHWPIMPDGSRMRFVPIIMDGVKNKAVYKHLNEHLTLQAISKAGEIKLDLEMWDIHSKRDYLHGQTLEQVLHGLTSNTRQGIPIIKHISKKWSRNPDKIDYEIAIAPSMLHEAQVMLNTVRSVFKTKFGAPIHQHFIPPHRQWMSRYQGKTRGDPDPDIESFILDTSVNDEYSKVLIEGMTDTQNLDTSTEALNAMVIVEGKKETTNHEVNTSSKSVISDMSDPLSVMTGLTKNSENGKTATWDEITLAKEEEDVVKANESQIKKLSTAINRYNITTSEIESWKNENESAYDHLIGKYKKQEYEIIRDIILDILKCRQSKQDDINEVNKMSELIDLSNETDAPEMSLLQEGQNEARDSLATQPSQSTIDRTGVGQGP